MERCRDKFRHLFHISWENHDGEVFYPRVPANRMLDEDDCTDRVCVSPLLCGCYSAISELYEDFVFIHRVVNLNELEQDENLWYPDLDEVPDVLGTHEIWATGPVELECICVAKVIRGQFDRYEFIPIFGFPLKRAIDYFEYEFNEILDLPDDSTEKESFMKNIEELADYFSLEYSNEFTL